MSSRGVEPKLSPSQKRRRRAERNAVRRAACNTSALKSSLPFIPWETQKMFSPNSLETRVADFEWKLNRMLCILESWCAEFAHEEANEVLSSLVGHGNPSMHAERSQTRAKLNPHAEPFNPPDIPFASENSSDNPVDESDLVVAETVPAADMSKASTEGAEPCTAESMATPRRSSSSKSSLIEHVFQDLVNAVAFDPSRRVREFLPEAAPAQPCTYSYSNRDLENEAALQANVDIGDVVGVGQVLAKIRESGSPVASHVALSTSQLLFVDWRTNEYQPGNVQAMQPISQPSNSHGGDLQRGCAFTGLDYASATCHADSKTKQVVHSGSDDTVLARRAAARLRQIQIGKSQPEYQQYLREVPISQRVAGQHPCTPDPESDLSKREFDRVLSQWRRQLHAWDHERTRHRYTISLETWL